MHGALLVDKPSGPTSHDIVAFARRVAEDAAPSATPARSIRSRPACSSSSSATPRGCRQFLVTDEKEYVADVRLGQSTPTYDAQGLDAARRDARGGEARCATSRSSRFAPSCPSSSALSRNYHRAFSAKKVGGVRAYKKARKNEPVELKPVEVTVRELEIVPTRPPRTSHLPPRASRLAPRIRPPPPPHRLQLRLLRPLPRARHRATARVRRAPRGAAADPRRPVPGRRRPDPGRDRGGGTGDRGPADRAQCPAGRPAGAEPDRRGDRRVGNGNTLAPAHLVAPSGRGARTPANTALLDPSGRLLSVAERRPDGLLHPLLVLR